MDDVQNTQLQPLGRTSRAFHQVRPTQNEVLLARMLLHLYSGGGVSEDLVTAVEAIANIGGE